MRFRLRTLLFVLALGPPLIAAMWFDFGLVLAIGLYLLGMALFSAGTRYLARYGPDQEERDRSRGVE